MRNVGLEHTDILLQENRLFAIRLVACFLTEYNITRQSWLFLFNIGSDVHLRFAGHNEQGPGLTETSPIKRLLVSNNQLNSGYLLIYFYYKFFERRKEEKKKIYEIKSSRLRSQILCFLYVSSFSFKGKSHFQ